jgi:hypothetical protein
MAHNNSNFVPNSIFDRNLCNGWDFLPPERLAGFSVHALCNIGCVPCLLVVSTEILNATYLLVHCGSSKSQLHIEMR